MFYRIDVGGGLSAIMITIHLYLPITFPKQWLKAFLLPVFLLPSACVTHTLNQVKIEQFLLARQPEQALEQLEGQKTKKRDRVVYLLDKGMLQRMKGDLLGSNQSLEEAKQLSLNLSAVSFREQSSAMSVNDSLRSYVPPPFEQALIYCIKAINYLELKQGDAARVESLQLNEILKKNKAITFPFARYITGLIFDFNHEPDNALIAYRKAYEGYLENVSPVPIILKQDLLRLTNYLGIHDEHDRYKEIFKLKVWPSQHDLNENSTVLAIIFNGLIPRKHSQEINAQSFSDWQFYRIAVPFYEKRASSANSLKLKSVEKLPIKYPVSGLLSQLDGHAEAALKDEMPKITGRAVARAAVKNVTVNKATKENPLLGIALNIVTFVSEVADTRGWYTLPQEILFSRLILPAGAHTEIAFHSPGMNGANDAGNGVEIDRLKGQLQVMSWYWPESTVTYRVPQ